MKLQSALQSIVLDCLGDAKDPQSMIGAIGDRSRSAQTLETSAQIICQCVLLMESEVTPFWFDLVLNHSILLHVDPPTQVH